MNHAQHFLLRSYLWTKVGSSTSGMFDSVCSWCCGHSLSSLFLCFRIVFYWCPPFVLGYGFHMHLSEQQIDATVYRDNRFCPSYSLVRSTHASTFSIFQSTQKAPDLTDKVLAFHWLRVMLCFGLNYSFKHKYIGMYKDHLFHWHMYWSDRKSGLC